MTNNVRVPDATEQKIIRQNGLDPDKVGVQHRADNLIVLLNYKTRDNITIHRGDKAWS